MSRGGVRRDLATNQSPAPMTTSASRTHHRALNEVRDELMNAGSHYPCRNWPFFFFRGPTHYPVTTSSVESLLGYVGVNTLFFIVLLLFKVHLNLKLTFGSASNQSRSASLKILIKGLMENPTLRGGADTWTCN